MKDRKYPQIEIHNFGPIQDFSCEIQKFNVITGPQASGKSTIAKLIFFCRTMKNEIISQLMLPHGSDIYEVDVKKGLEKRLRGKFLQMFGSTWAMPMDMKVLYAFREDVWIRIFLEKDRNDRNPNFAEFEFSESLKRFVEEKKGAGDYQDVDEIIRLRQEVDRFLEDEYESIYIPSGRGMITLLTDQLNYIFTSILPTTIDYCTRSYVENIMKLRPVMVEGLKGLLTEKLSITQEKIDQKKVRQMLEYADKVLKGSYYYEAGEERLRIQNNRYVKINYASSGQQESVWIFNLMFYYLLNNKKVFLILEEPEVHLYPEAQQIITQAMGLYANGGNCVLVTTHSPYILGELNNLLYAFKVPNIDGKRDRIIKSCSILDPRKTEAFHIDTGKSENAMEDNLIRNDLIDGASQNINEENDKLMELYWESQGN